MKTHACLLITSLLVAPLAAGPGDPPAPPAPPAVPRVSVVPRAKANSATRRLHELFDAEWEWAMKEFPEWATSVGDPRYNDRWTDNSAEAIEARHAHAREVLKKAESLAKTRSKLSPEDQVNLDLFTYNARLYVEGQRFHDEYIVITQMGGPQNEAADVAQSMPKNSVKDYEDFLKRLRAVPTTIDQDIELLKKGAAEGITPPREVMGEVPHLIDNVISEDPDKSPIYTEAFDQISSAISQSDQKRLRDEVRTAIREAVTPALHKFHDFYVNEYAPKLRTTLGLGDMPDGKAWYEFRIKDQTTTTRTADDIHQLGLDEVKRIRTEMGKIKDQTGFKGSLQEFFTFLRTDKQFFCTSKEELLAAYRDIGKRIDPELPRLFRTLPRLTYGVRPVPAYSEKTQTTAYYSQGSPEAGRAGYFYANTYDLAARPKWEMEALTAHEAVPGHHLQIALAQEQGALPRFRQFGGYTAYVEGWGLYAESLGTDLGLYKDPYSRFGQLTYEMWRAVRLVVDTGIHSKGWTRQQAIDYFKDNAGKSEHDIEVEVDRYIVWPGQALAYKIGELKIKELRAYAQKELGPRFNIRDFHDQVLLPGAVPLDVLEKNIKDWVAQEKQ